MRKKAIAGILLICCMAIGFWLPDFVFGVQDKIQTQQSHRYSLTLPEKTASKSEAVDYDYWERLSQFRNAGHYVRFDLAVDEAEIAEPVALVISCLKTAGVIDDDDFQTVELATQISVSQLAPDRPMTVWKYTGVNANDDNLILWLDSESGMAMRIEIYMNYPENISSETQTDRWRAFIRKYYLSDGSDVIHVLQNTPTDYTFSILNGTNEPVELPLQALGLYETDSADYLTSYKYRLN